MKSFHRNIRGQTRQSCGFFRPKFSLEPFRWDLCIASTYQWKDDKQCINRHLSSRTIRTPNGMLLSHRLVVSFFDNTWTPAAAIKESLRCLESTHCIVKESKMNTIWNGGCFYHSCAFMLAHELGRYSLKAK